MNARFLYFVCGWTSEFVMEGKMENIASFDDSAWDLALDYDGLLDDCGSLNFSWLNHRSFSLYSKLNSWFFPIEFDLLVWYKLSVNNNLLRWEKNNLLQILKKTVVLLRIGVVVAALRQGTFWVLIATVFLSVFLFSSCALTSQAIIPRRWSLICLIQDVVLAWG